MRCVFLPIFLPLLLKLYKHLQWKELWSLRYPYFGPQEARYISFLVLGEGNAWAAQWSKTSVKGEEHIMPLCNDVSMTYNGVEWQNEEI